jgi:hypothetical protein
MFVLIWTVQLVIYPSFCYSNEADIKRWHRIYTQRVTIIVLPLMMSQLGLYIYAFLQDMSLVLLASLLLVLLNWAITFFVAVPLHGQIDAEEDSFAAREKLVKVNWSRTVLWTLILIINLATYAK